jgi:protein-tyrosine phosphatase
MRRRLAGNPSLIFICRGNICRSPFAEAYARLRLHERGIGHVQLSSAGTYPMDQRPSPKLAREVSREFGVGIDDHLSRTLSAASIESCGAVVCMDMKDFTQLRQSFPAAKGKVFFLKVFDATTRDFQIVDPWGKSVDEFRACFRQVSASVDGLVEAMVDLK